MLHKFKISLVIIGILAWAAGCSTYPDGPVISLKSKEARIANTWKVVKATDKDGEDATDSFDGYRYTFSEDGTAVVDWGAIQLNGTWELRDEDLTFHIDVKTDLGFPSFDREFTINRLTEDEFWLQDRDEEMATMELETF